MSRAGGRRIPPSGLQACYDFDALPCPKHLFVSHLESQFSAQFNFFFAFGRRKRAMIRRSALCVNWRGAFLRNCRETKLAA